VLGAVDVLDLRVGKPGGLEGGVERLEQLLLVAEPLRQVLRRVDALSLGTDAELPLNGELALERFDLPGRGP
jgi:hypothetical protein